MTLMHDNAGVIIIIIIIMIVLKLQMWKLGL